MRWQLEREGNISWHNWRHNRAKGHTRCKATEEMRSGLTDSCCEKSGDPSASWLNCSSHQSSTYIIVAKSHEQRYKDPVESTISTIKGKRPSWGTRSINCKRCKVEQIVCRRNIWRRNSFHGQEIFMVELLDQVTFFVRYHYRASCCNPGCRPFLGL